MNHVTLDIYYEWIPVVLWCLVDDIMPLSGLQSTPTSSWCSLVGVRILGAEWSMKHQRHMYLV